MVLLDYAVLAGYFLLMMGIGVWVMRRVKVQEDYFMGGRSFGKLLQAFAAFGAGTGSSDPVNTANTTFLSGLSGMWSVMYWLFVTPFYWITGVWYRRMRHLTLGDWFVERYESRRLGVAYAVFGILFFMVYGSMMFSAIGKVAAPMVETDQVTILGQTMGIEYVLVPVIGVVVLLYGIAGGLEAAYYTDLIQGLCVIFLSIVLIPFGLSALVERFGDPDTQSWLHGFVIMHQQVPESYFNVVGSTSTAEFPLHRIVAVVIINLVGIVVQPHFIATGGGSAKTEYTARVGLVTGNFLKRFCTVGWVLTSLIVVALFADNLELIKDPQRAWGVASRELLGPGLTGLMLACLFAALMSSVDAYMVVGSALVVRNIYVPYFDPNASEKRLVGLARVTGALIVAGAVLISLSMMNVLDQLELTWVFPVLFAAPFWVGMYWRRATPAAAWVTVAFCAATFFLIPYFAPMAWPELRTDPRFLGMNQIVETSTTWAATPADVARREALIRDWDAQATTIAAQDNQPIDSAAVTDVIGEKPASLAVGDDYTVVDRTGGQSIFWTKGVYPVDADGNRIKTQPQAAGNPEVIDEHTTRQLLLYGDDVELRGFGNFRLEFLLYYLAGIDLSQVTNATMSTLELPAKIISPFLIMILVSLVTPPNTKTALDRYYAKMKTPVDPDHAKDLQKLEAAYADPGQFESQKLLPGTNFEASRPNRTDVVGFVVCFAVCFLIIALAVWSANIGG
ncbi:MAG: sodium:solute symporter family protein [Planctomycetales bacterium]|nr:sodium:solute symporter family protein [Planctomycetales bacterium]